MVQEVASLTRSNGPTPISSTQPVARGRTVKPSMRVKSPHELWVRTQLLEDVVHHHQIFSKLVEDFTEDLETLFIQDTKPSVDQWDRMLWNLGEIHRAFASNKSFSSKNTNWIPVGVFLLVKKVTGEHISDSVDTERLAISFEARFLVIQQRLECLLVSLIEFFDEGPVDAGAEVDSDTEERRHRYHENLINKCAPGSSALHSVLWVPLHTTLHTWRRLRNKCLHQESAVDLVPSIYKLIEQCKLVLHHMKEAVRVTWETLDTIEALAAADKKKEVEHRRLLWARLVRAAPTSTNGRIRMRFILPPFSLALTKTLWETISQATTGQLTSQALKLLTTDKIHDVAANGNTILKGDEDKLMDHIVPPSSAMNIGRRRKLILTSVERAPESIIKAAIGLPIAALGIRASTIIERASGSITQAASDIVAKAVAHLTELGILRA